MKKFYTLICIALFVSYFTADAQKKKTKRVKKAVKKTIVAAPIKTDTLNESLLLCYTRYDMPSWYLAVNKDFRFPVDMQQPAEYRLATINDTLFTNYLKTIPYEVYNKKVNLPLYANYSIACKEFAIQRVVTMDSALQAKYPNLMSFKAVDEANPLNTARIDCDGNTTQIMMSIDGETYYATPILFNKKTYYACYSKGDPNFTKRSFE